MCNCTTISYTFHARASARSPTSFLEWNFFTTAFIALACQSFQDLLSSGVMAMVARAFFPPMPLCCGGAM